MKKLCTGCNQQFDGRRDAKTCTSRCRKRLQRLSSIASQVSRQISDEVKAVEHSIEESAHRMIENQDGFVNVGYLAPETSLELAESPAQAPQDTEEQTSTVINPVVVEAEPLPVQPIPLAVENIPTPVEQGSILVPAQKSYTTSPYKTRYRKILILSVKIVVLIIVILGLVTFAVIKNTARVQTDEAKTNLTPKSVSNLPGVSPQPSDKQLAVIVPASFSKDVVIAGNLTVIGTINGIKIPDALGSFGGAGTGVTNVTNIIQGGGGVTDINGLADSVTIQGTLNQITVTTGSGAVTLTLPQGIGVTSSPTFAGLNINGDITLGSVATIFGNTVKQTGAGNNIAISAGLDLITFTAGGRSFVFPTSGPASQTICTTGVSCAAGGGQAVLLAPGSAQTDNTADVSIFINDTGGGNLLQLQTGGIDKFVLSNTGAVTATSFAGDGSALTALNANELTSGTVPTGRISGSYAGITGLGTITVGIWNGTALIDTYVNNDLTISSSGSVDWTALTGYPGACAAGSAVTTIGDTLTCSAFAVGTSANYIQNGTIDQNTANFNIQSTGTTNVTAKFRALASQTADIIQVRNSGDTATVFGITPAGVVTATSFSGVGSALTALNATELTSGTVPVTRLSGSYTGITGLGTITVGTWNGDQLTDIFVSDTLTSSLFVGSGSTTTAIDLATAEVAGVLPDANVADNLTISSSGLVDWLALTNYPTACAVGSAVSTLADVPACTAFNTDTAISLQDAYGVGNIITTTDGRNITITLADTATDQTLEITQAGTADILRVNDDGTLTDTTPFVIDASGNVGIGVSTPTSFVLQVAGNVGPNANNTYDLGSGSLGWRTLYGATSVLTPGIDTISAGVLAVGNSNATSVSICNSANCDTVSIATNADADLVNIGDSLDTVNVSANALTILGGTSVNINSTGSATTAIGNTTGATTILGATTINATGTNALAIGNTSAGVLTLQGNTKIDNQGNEETLGYINTPFGGFGQYSNLITRSEALATTWVATNITVTSNDGASNPAPDGQTTADKLVSTAINGTLVQTYTTTANGNYTFSMWVKTNSGTQPIQLRIDSTGATPLTGIGASFTATTSWQRFDVTQNFTGTPSAIKPTLTIINNAATVVGWGAQLEAASKVGVYARTTVSNVATSSRGLVSNGSAYFMSENVNAVGLTVQTSSGQVADILNVQNSAGTNYLAVTSAGDVVIDGLLTTRFSGTTGGNPLTVTPGVTNVASGIGAALNLTGGTESGTGSTGGAVVIQGGNSTGASGTRTGGAVTIDAGTGATQNGTISIGTTNATSVTVGNTNGSSPLRLSAGTGGISLGDDAISNTIQIGNSTGDLNQTLNIGSNPSPIAINDVTLGSTGSTSSTAIQGGSGASAVVIRSATGGTISIGGGAIANTIRIGNASGAVAQTINIGTNTAASSATTLLMGSTIGTSTTTLQSGSGGIVIPASLAGTVNTSTYLCRNSSNQLTTCLTTGTGAAFVQGGNSFAAQAILGTNDANSLAFETNNTTRLVIDTSGNAELTGNLNFTKETTRTIKINDSTTAATAGAQLNILGANGNGAVGGVVAIQGGTVNSGSFDGGAVTVTGGTSTGFTTGGALTLAGGGGFSGGAVTINGGVGSTFTGAVNIQSQNGTAMTQSVSIGGGTSTTSGGKVVNIANGVPGASTTNAVNIGTAGTTTGTVGITIGSIGAAAHTTTIQGGNGTGAIAIQAAASGTINLGTNSALAAVSVGSANVTTTTVAASGTLSLQSGVVINAGTANATAITIGSTTSAASLILRSGTGDVTIESTDLINIGANAVAQTITIGNATGATAVSVLCGTAACGFGNNAVAHTTTVGSVTGTATTNLQGGTGGVNVGTGGIANTVQIGNTTGAVAQTINVGTNGAASSTTTLLLGSTIGTSTTTLQSGSGGIVMPASLAGTVNTATYLCRNSSNQLTTCLTTGTGAAFVQGGNSFGAIAELGTNDNFDLQFETNGTTKLTVLANGNIGIGTTGPTSLLHVVGSQPVAVATNGTAATQALQVTGGKGGNTTGTTGQVGGTGAVANITAGAGGDAPAGSTNGNGGSITLQGGAPGAGLGTAGTYGNLLLQTTGGNVGIGTSAPAGNLHVYSTVDGGKTINIDAQGTATSQQAVLNLLTLGDGTKGIGNAATKGWSLLARGNAWSTTDAQNDLRFSYWNGSTFIAPITIDSLTGNVGIGDTDPAAMLSVGSGDLFQVSSAGQVLFNGVATDITTTTNENLTIAPGGSGDTVFTLDSDTNVQFNATAPAVDTVVINSGTSITSGVDALQITHTSSNASGNAVDITPSYTGGATDALVYNVIDIDAFTATNAAGTDTVRGINLGALTESGAGVVTSLAINIGTGWDNAISLQNGEVINNATDDQISLTGTGGTNNTDITFDLDGATNAVPTIQSTATHINIFDNLSIGLDGSTAESINNAGFSFSGDDLYVQDSVGINGNLYVDGNSILEGTISVTGVTGFTLGTGADSVTSTSGKLRYAGTARNNKSIVLSPEYAGGSLSTDGSTTNSGTLTSSNTGSGSAWRNFYEWITSQSASQDYTIMVRVTLPDDFSAWQTGTCNATPSITTVTDCALEISMQTGLAATTNNGVTVTVNNDTDTPGTAVCSISEGAATAWSTFGCSGSTLDDAVAPEWDAAGETAIIRIKVKANSTASALARVGDIRIRYLSAY